MGCVSVYMQKRHLLGHDNEKTIINKLNHKCLLIPR